MIARNVTISFSIVRLKLIEQALKKSERLFDYRHRKMIKGAYRQIQCRLEQELASRQGRSAKPV